MADATTPFLPFDDDDDIPIVDSSGSQRVLKGGYIIDLGVREPVVEVAETSPVPVAPPVKPVPAPVAAPVPDLTVKPAVDFVLDTKAIEDEVTAAAIARPNQEAVVAATTVVTDQWEKMADEAAAEANLQLSDDLRRRFRNLAAMFFRDLRDELETVSKMTMTVASGGLGLPDGEADRVMALLQARNASYRNEMNSKSAAAMRDFAAIGADRQMRQGDQREAAEKVNNDSLYQRVTEKIGKPSALSAPAAPTVTAPRIIPVIHEDAAGGPTVISPASSASPSPVAAEPLTMAVPTSPLVPAETVMAAAAKPAVMDVSAIPKLIGPVEELRALRIVDFRRLSKDPREACLKIRDKVDLLAERSFAEKDRGVKAWQDSEVNRMYLDLLRASLEGKPVPDVIAKREFDGDPTLSKLEFDAIMELNRKLRFG
jgi:hypothetical protein